MTKATTVLEFVTQEAPRLWHGNHLLQSCRKVDIFAAFADYSTRAVGTYKPSHVHKFFDYLTNDKGYTDNTVNHYAACLTKVFKHAAKEGLIKQAPQFTWKPVPKESPRPLYYTQGQLAAMEAHFTEDHPQWWMRHLIIIGHQTGMRLGEIRQINPSTMITDEDGAQWVYLSKTKNGCERYVPANDRVLEAVKALGGNVSTHWTSEHFYMALTEVRKVHLGGDKRYNFHTLRHTAATRLANDFKANTAVIGMLLGHKSDKTTRKYIKAKPSALQSMARHLASA